MNKSFFIRPNPTPGAGAAFADVCIHLPCSVHILALASRVSTGNLYLHFTPLNKDVSGGAVIVNGTEQWIPLYSADRKYPIIKFHQSISLFYVTGDGGGSAPDFSLLCTDDIEELIESTGGSSTIPNPLPVTGPLTDTQLRATPVPVSGPLTDTQLRATPVPVSGTVTASGPLTDTQLRATPVPVSGTVTASGPLTDTQLRATPVDTNLSKIRGVNAAVDSGTHDGGTLRVVIATDQPAVPISAASLPLPTGAATEATLAETHGTKAAGTAATKSDLVGMIAASAAPAPTNGQQIAFQGDLLGNVRINPTGQVGSFSFANNSPAAGNDATLTVPAGHKWRVKALHLELVTSATVANRSIILRTRTPSSGFNLAYFAAIALQAASLTGLYDFFSGAFYGASIGVPNRFEVPYPELVLGPGCTINTQITNIQAGDTVVLTAMIEDYSD